jgi:uncharacterized membrane protein
MSSIESSKTLGIIGTLLLVIGIFVPWGGIVVDIIGIILFMMAIKGFSAAYNDPAMYQNAFTGIIYYIIAAIAAGIAFSSLALGAFGSIFLLGFGIIVFIVALIAAFIFYVLAAKRLRTTFNDLAKKTGEHNFETAGTLLWWGAILTIIVVGLFLIFIAWIFALIAFLSMRTTAQQPYPPPPPAGPATAAPGTRYCPNCGQPVDANATFCPHCGKPLPPA